MATAYKADSYADVQITAPWGVGQTWIRPFQFNIATGTANTGFIVNDTLALCPIPYRDASVGVLVVDFHIEIPSLDTGNSIRISIGDTNGTANAFQATWYSAVELGSNVASCVNGTLAIGATHAAATVIAKNGTAPGDELPKQYSISQLYASYVAFPTIDFMLKVTTAPNTATTTGTIRGWLMLQTLNTSAVTWA
jgi:hypothetical protein